jgi:DNA-binding NtrC family response regulator
MYPPRRIPRVLVVGDEVAIARILARILMMQGYCAIWFTNLLEALAHAKTQSPDLLLSDVMMPQLCGVDLAIQIKESNPRCEILLLSGHAGFEDLLYDARERGHHFELRAKPIDPSLLLADIRNILER